MVAPFNTEHFNYNCLALMVSRSLDDTRVSVRGKNRWADDCKDQTLPQVLSEFSTASAISVEKPTCAFTAGEYNATSSKKHLRMNMFSEEVSY